jgi:2-oxo-4-hydroxy-4-carboxy-5-ureidoimidazoline decarboxylase
LNHALVHLNLFSPDEALQAFLKCCGSGNWAQRMVDERPFANVEELLGKADSIWWSLESSDWFAAFRGHPKIGERKAAEQVAAQSRAWSDAEQSGIRDAAEGTAQALAEGNREYEQRFGYIFIVCATGKTATEMLGILRERLSNDPDLELRVAAEEQRKITRLRLKKLLER